MRILFCRSWLPGSVLIRALTFSEWSHAALVDGDHVIEATWPKVRRVPLARVIASHSAHAFGQIEVQHPDSALRFADRQIGRPYDITALAALVAGRREWDEPDSWFCSELVAAALNGGGADLFRDAWRVTPQMLWQLSRP